MKKDFYIVAKKTQLFSELATVFILNVVKSRITATENGKVVKDKEFKPLEVQGDFLSALKEHGIRHEVIHQEEGMLIFAVAPAKNIQTTGLLHRFFRGEHGCTFGGYSMQQSSPDSFDWLKKPFSRLRREVSRKAKELGG